MKKEKPAKETLKEEFLRTNNIKSQADLEEQIRKHKMINMALFTK